MLVAVSPHKHTATTVDLERDFGGSLRKWNQYWSSVSRGTIAPTQGEYRGGQAPAQNEGWFIYNVTLEKNVTLAPDGTMTAMRVTDDATNAGHVRGVQWGAGDETGPIYYDHVAYVKADTLDHVHVGRQHYDSPYESFEAMIDLTTGVVTDSGSNLSTLESVTVTDAGDGWWKVVEKGTDGAMHGRQFWIGTSTGPDLGDQSYSGDGTGSVFLWGMRVRRSDAPYRPGSVVKLTIPAGSFGAYASGNAIADGGSGKVVVVGAGVANTFVQVGNIFPTNYSGTPGVSRTGDVPWPRFETALAGASSITLSDLADVDEFDVGMWVELVCLDMQAFGYPLNNYFFEFRQITAIDTDTGEITFDDVLHHDYKDTYPFWYGGSTSFADQGGTPTIFPMGVRWDFDVTMKGVTISNAVDDQMFGNCRRCLLMDCDFPGAPLDPSQAISWIHRRVSNTGKFIEVDKSVTWLEYTDCTTGKIQFQSAGSIEDVLIQGCNVTHIEGGGTRTIIRDTDITVNLILGCTSYGVSQSCEIEDCFVEDMSSTVGGNREAFPGATAITSINTSGVGVMTITNAGMGGGDNRLMYIPGCKYFFAGGTGGNSTPPGFEILDMTQDATNTYLHTSLSGTYPAITDGTAGTIIPNTMADLTVINCTGCHQIESLSRSPANASWGTYYDSGVLTNDFLTTTYSFPIHGTFVSATFEVTKAYTGTKSNLRLAIHGLFGGFYYPDHMTAAPDTRANPSALLTAVGTVVVTAGDLGATPQWMKSTVGLKIFDLGGTAYNNLDDEDASVWPEVRVTVITDHGYD